MSDNQQIIPDTDSYSVALVAAALHIASESMKGADNPYDLDEWIARYLEAHSRLQSGKSKQ